MKNWILNLEFVKQAIQDANAHGVVVGMNKISQGMEYQIERIANERMSNLLGVVDENHIITLNNKKKQVFYLLEVKDLRKEEY